MNFEYQKNNWKTFFWTCFWVALSLIFISGIVWLFCASAEIDGNLKVVGCGNKHHWLHHFRWFKYFGLLGIYAIIVVIKNYREHLKKFRWENYKTVKMSYKHFKDTHLINTKRWHVNKDNGQLKYNLQTTKSYYDEWVQVLFSFPDWCKFNIYYWMRQHAKKIQEQEDEEKERNELLARVIKEMQKDVNKAFEELAVPDKTDPEPETADLDKYITIGHYVYKRSTDWIDSYAIPSCYTKTGVLNERYRYYLDDSIAYIVDTKNNKECEYILEYSTNLKNKHIYYDPTDKCYYEVMQSNAATSSIYNSASYSQIQNTIQELANLKVKVSTLDNLINTANEQANNISNTTNGANCIFTRTTQLDNRYSLYYTSDENKVYLYDTHTGTYNQIY